MSRSVLVTGASKGIGEAVVRQFAQADDIADVIMLARPSEDFDRLEKDLRGEAPEGLGDSVRGGVASLGDAGDGQRLVSREVGKVLDAENVGDAEQHRQPGHQEVAVF